MPQGLSNEQLLLLWQEEDFDPLQLSSEERARLLQLVGVGSQQAPDSKAAPIRPVPSHDPTQVTPNEASGIGGLLGLNPSLLSGRTTLSDLPKLASDLGVPETVGGIAGSALGGIPGAMTGAGAVRAGRGMLTGEDPASTLMGTTGQALLEGAFPAIGGLLRSGRGLVRGALTIPEEIAKNAGKGVAHRGQDILADRAIREPGVTLRRAHDAARSARQGAESEVNRITDAATASGQTLNLQPVLDVGEKAMHTGRFANRIGSPEQKRGAQSVLDDLREQVTNTRDMSPEETVGWLRGGGGNFADPPRIRDIVPQTPRQVRDKLKNTKFISGAPDVPGAAEMTRELRTALSELFKDEVPGIGDQFAREHDLIPLEKILDKTIFSKRGGGTGGEVVASGSGLPRLLAILKPPKGSRFTVGKVMSRTGQSLAPIEDLIAALLRAGGVNP